MTLADQIRAACSRVTAGARHVRVHEDRVEAYAAGIERLDVYPAPAIGLPSSLD